VKIPDGIRKFAEVFAEFPGIGPRQAVRLAFHLVYKGGGVEDQAIKAIESLKDIKICRQCFYIHDGKGDLCGICSDKSRDGSVIAIVEKETDLMSIESTGKFNGRYMVIGDLRKKSVLEPDQKLRLKSLKSYIALLPGLPGQGAKAKEIIVAVNPTSVGNLNAVSISDELKSSAEKITRLGVGIPTGGEIEFADAETLGASLERRG